MSRELGRHSKLDDTHAIAQYTHLNTFFEQDYFTKNPFSTYPKSAYTIASRQSLAPKNTAI